MVIVIAWRTGRPQSLSMRWPQVISGCWDLFPQARPLKPERPGHAPEVSDAACRLTLTPRDGYR